MITINFSKKLQLLKNKQNIPLDDDNVFPASKEIIPLLPRDAKTLAKDQTFKARSLLYSPNQIIKAQLNKAATNLLHFIQDFKDEEFTDGRFNRALHGGVFDGKSKADEIEAFTRVKDGKGSGSDNAAFMALLGDIGTAIMDYEPSIPSNARVEDIQKNELYRAVIKSLVKIIYPKESESTAGEKLINIGKQIKAARGGSAIAPSKKKGERKNGGLSARAGILGTGAEVDKELKKDETTKIKYAKWPEQLIKFARIKSSKEPWAGHMSGSIVEVHFVFDLMVGDNALISYNDKENTKGLDTRQRKARAAISAAFLIGLGYHSALEVYETTTSYLGHNYRNAATFDKTKDIAQIKTIIDGGATKYIDNLMAEFTDRANLKKLN